MKRFYIALVVLTLIFTCCLLVNWKIQRDTTAMKNEIDRIWQAVDVQDIGDADDAMQQLLTLWCDHKHLFQAVTGSTYCAPFESALERAAVWLDQMEISELSAELSELHSRIDQLWDTQALDPKNLC